MVRVQAALVLLAGMAASATEVVSNSYVTMGLGDDGRFGLATTGGKPGDSSDDNKYLVFGGATGYGSTGGLAIKIDSTVYALEGLQPARPLTRLAGNDGGVTGWTIAHDGDSIDVDVRYQLVDNGSGQADTVKVTVTVQNTPARAQAIRVVGVKFGMDTQIGSNDGAPIATDAGIVAVETGFGPAYNNPVPNFWQALERNDLGDPGLVARGTLTGGGATTPDKVILGQYPQASSSGAFDHEPSGLSYSGDSAVGIWWLDRTLAPDSSLQFVTFYGLGDFSGVSGGNLAMSVSAPSQATLNAAETGFDPFTVQAIVQNDTGSPVNGASLELTFPSDGLELLSGSSPVTVTLPTGQTLVAWTVRPQAAASDSTRALLVTLTTGGQTLAADRGIQIPPLPVNGNRTPVPMRDRAVTTRGASARVIDVLENDADPDGEPLTVIAVTTTTGGGTAMVAGGGTEVTYAPAPGFIGWDSFRYTVSDGNGGEAQAAVAVYVANDPAAIAQYPPAGAGDVRIDATFAVGLNVAPMEMCRVEGANQRSGVPDYDFMMARRPVTVKQYLAFLNHAAASADAFGVTVGTNGSLYQGTPETGTLLFDISQTREAGGSATAGGFDYGFTYAANATDPYSAAAESADFPIVGVTWHGAVFYCGWLSMLRGIDLDQMAYGIEDDAGTWYPSTLTDSEWSDGFDETERAAWLAAVPDAYRLAMDGGAEGHSAYNEYLWAAIGTQDPGSTPFAVIDGGNQWNSGDTYDNGPTPGGYYDANARGIEDLSGNVWEWLTDAADTVPRNGDGRAVRGGSWYTDGIGVGSRYAVESDGAFSDLGFRPVVTAPDYSFQIDVALDDAFVSVVARNYNPLDSQDFGTFEREWQPDVMLAPATRYYWRVRAYDYRNAAWSSWTAATFRTSTQVPIPSDLQLELDASWRLISLDRDPAERDAHRLFGPDVIAWAWDPATRQYVRPRTVAALMGLWAVDPGGRSMTSVSGFTPLTETVAFGAGWNLFGAPASMPLPPTGILMLPLYTFDPLTNRYLFVQSGDILSVGVGYWGYARVPGTLSLSYEATVED